MDSWLKKLNDNDTKPTADDVETAVKTNATRKSRSSVRKMRPVIPKKDHIMIVFCSIYGFTFITENTKQ